MNKKRVLIIVMSLLYMAAGTIHFIHPLFYVKIIPAYFPIPLELVYISGICEMGLGLFVLFQKTRKIACWLIIAMLIVFLSIHIQMLIDNYDSSGLLFWVLVLRIPLQFVLMRWAWVVSKY
jgi:uncharacterized membrane protein